MIDLQPNAMATEPGDGGPTTSDRSVAAPRITVVADRRFRAETLTRVLCGHGYRHVAAVDTSAPVDPTRADIVVVDLSAAPSGVWGQFERALAPLTEQSARPVLALTGVGCEARKAALALGARECLSAPFETEELLRRLAQMVEHRALQSQLAVQSRRLEDALEDRLRDLERLELESLERLARAVEYRDDQTGNHTQRVAETAAEIAGALGLPADDVELIRLAAPMHDVGKVGIPDRILLKQGALTPDEFAEMQRHTVIGAQILGAGRSPVLQAAEQIALTHHERWDGDGYLKLSGDTIPLASRIVTVADVYDALVHERPYKPAWTHESAVAEIAAQRGRQFDPRVVDAFLHAVA